MFYVLANNLGLDLVNTRIVDNGTPVDLLNGFEDLLAWSVAIGLIDRSKAAKARRKWAGTREAQALFNDTLVFRDTLKLIAEELAKGRSVSRALLDGLNEILSRKRGFFEIRPVDGGFQKQFHSETLEITALLSPIAESAADLLCFGDLAHVRKCENDACVLFFYDTSKSHRRRWCSMASCGNRAKAKAFYRRISSR